MSDLTEKFKNLEVSNELFKDVKFYVTGEVDDEVRIYQNSRQNIVSNSILFR